MSKHKENNVSHKQNNAINIKQLTHKIYNKHKIIKY